ncbi:MAG: thioesterase family protein [Saprospiraceae bacterium]|nr:thioesterase family protein [Saprospiraceae bacterium]
MDSIIFTTQVMWSQIDANMHLRHSAYADFGAQARLVAMEKAGFTSESMRQYKIGPILFREELIYKKEIRPNEIISVTNKLSKCRADGSRWSILHEIIKESGEIAAIIHTDGAWIDQIKRKLTALPDELVSKLLRMSKTEDFILEEVPV